MSKRLIDRSPDLKRLRDEGFDIEVTRSAHLLVKGVPYVNSRKEIAYGTLVSELTLAGDVTGPPGTHVAMFVGDYPCDKDGREINQIRHGNGQLLAENLVVHFSFSSKPATGYKDYYDKMTAYVAIIMGPAQALHPAATAQTFPVYVLEPEESVFQYLDTASSRAGITMATRKLEGARVAIVGVGGTGSYVLDMVAKTPIKEIHLFDGDTFLSHNAFRAPGAASVEELRAAPKKVVYLREKYSKLHRGIIDHPYHIDAPNVAELQGMTIVFLAMDSGEDKQDIVRYLETAGTPFIDVGMGVDVAGDSLTGILRATTSTPDRREHLRQRVSLATAEPKDEYDSNIQIADLNALNAAMAVIRWKKLCGFYTDFGHELHTTYSIDTNTIINDVIHEPADESHA